MNPDDYKIGVIWFVVCCVNHFLSDSYCALLIPQFNKRLSLDQRKSCRNRTTSTLHSILMCLLFLIYWSSEYNNFSFNSDSRRRNLRPIGDFEYKAMMVMMGYLVYDSVYEGFNFMFHLLDMSHVTAVAKKDKKGSVQQIPWRINYTSLTLLIHHLVGFMAHIAIIKFKCGLAARYLMFIYGAEMSTPFLNACWILMSLNLKNTRMYTFSGSGLLATFLWRNFIGLYTITSLTLEHHLWEGSTMNGRHFHKDDMLYYLLYGITVIFILLNLSWTYKLVKSAISDLQ